MRGKIVFPRMGFRKALGKNTSSSFHVLFTVEGNRTLEGILTIYFMPVKHEYGCCFCDHLALQTASPLTSDQPSLVYSRGAKSKGRPDGLPCHSKIRKVKITLKPAESVLAFARPRFVAVYSQ